MNEQLQPSAKNPTDRIRIIGKVTKIIATIIWISMLVGAGLTLLSGIVMCCMPKDVLQANVNVSAQVDVDPSSYGQWWSDLISIEGMPQAQEGGLQLRLFDTGLSVDGKTFSVNTLQFGGALICVAISLFLFSGVFYYVSRCGKTLNTVSSPFTTQCVKGLKQLAVSVLVWSLGSSILKGVMNTILKDASRYLNMDINSGSILLALALLAFAYIFQYGVSLQQQADTTL